MHVTKAEINSMDSRYRAAFINSLGGFKSLILVGTADSNGAANLSILNSLFHIGANPPLCGMIVRPNVEERHTLDNLLETGYYTVNHVRESFVHAAHQTSARYPKEVSEFEAVGLTPIWNQEYKVPFVGESSVKWLMQFREKHDLAINGTHIIIGEIMEVHIPDGVLQSDGFVDLEAAGTVTCSGLDAYHKTEKLCRLSYAKTDTWPTEI